MLRADQLSARETCASRQLGVRYFTLVDRRGPAPQSVRGASTLPGRRGDFEHFFQGGEACGHLHGTADAKRLHAFLVR